MKIYTPQELDNMTGFITEYVSLKKYPKSQAIARAKGSLPKDITPGGEIVLEEHNTKSAFSGRRATRYMVVSIVKDPKPEVTDGDA